MRDELTKDVGAQATIGVDDADNPPHGAWPRPPKAHRSCEGGIRVRRRAFGAKSKVLVRESAGAAVNP